MWKNTSGEKVHELGGEHRIAFSPDGSLLASSAYHSKIYLWGIFR